MGSPSGQNQPEEPEPGQRDHTKSESRYSDDLPPQSDSEDKDKDFQIPVKRRYR